jgi:hypothetical protein
MHWYHWLLASIFWTVVLVARRRSKSSGGSETRGRL